MPRIHHHASAKSKVTQNLSDFELKRLPSRQHTGLLAQYCCFTGLDPSLNGGWD
jgi:hypothetical protein